MTKNSDRFAATQYSPAPGAAARSEGGKKIKIYRQDTDAIDISSCEISSALAKGTEKNFPGDTHNEAGKAGISTGNQENTAEKMDFEEEVAEIAENDFDSPLEGELVKDTFFPKEDIELGEECPIIDVGSNLPAISSGNLPSVAVRDHLQDYIRQISKFPLLEPEEETALARRVRDTGDPEAAFRIISAHLRLVVRIAMDFQRRWMQNVLDLIQEGNVGLMRAMNKFDPDKGIKFSYYASFWIRAYILKFIMDNWRMVKLGTTQAQRKLFYNLNRERQKLLVQGFDPDAATLSKKLNVTEDQVIEMQQRLDAGDVSLDIPVSDESGSASRMDFLPARDPGVEESLAGLETASIIRDSIEDLVPLLSEKELYILEHRLLTDEPDTLREIGEHYHVTRERVRQLEARLLEKLKEHLGKKIKDFSADWISS